MHLLKKVCKTWFLQLQIGEPRSCVALIVEVQELEVKPGRAVHAAMHHHLPVSALEATLPMAFSIDSAETARSSKTGEQER